MDKQDEKPTFTRTILSQINWKPININADNEKYETLKAQDK